MKNQIKIQKEILALIDYNNTVMGGSVEPFVKIEEQETEYELKVQVPTLAAGELKIDINDQNLWIYQLMPVLKSTNETAFVPRTFGNITLPQNIDKEGITAKYQDNFWKITLPKDNSHKGFRRQLDIEI